MNKTYLLFLHLSQPILRHTVVNMGRETFENISMQNTVKE